MDHLSSPVASTDRSRSRALAVAACLALGCFGWVVLLPVGNNGILAPALALLGLSALVTLFFGPHQPARELHVIAGVAAVVGALGLVSGATNPGLSNGIYVAVLIPAFWWLCASAVGLGAIRPILTVVAWATVIGGAGILIYVLGRAGIAPQLLPDRLQEFVGAGYANDGSIAIRFYGLSSFVATAPMWLTACVLPRSVFLPPRALTIAAAICSLAAVLLGGRRALVVVALLVPFGVVAARLVLKVRRGEIKLSTTKAAGLGVVLVVTGAASLTLSAVRDAVAGILSLVTGEGRGEAEVLRAEQAGALLRDWRRSPFFGNGWGAGVEGYQRFVDRPWVYELQYHYLLAQVGVVGVMLLVFGGVLAVRMVLLAARILPDVAPALLVASAGALAMLIAHGSNPYLRVPGHAWSVALPLAFASAVLARERLSSRSRSGIDDGAEELESRG